MLTRMLNMSGHTPFSPQILSTAAACAPQKASKWYNHKSAAVYIIIQAYPPVQTFSSYIKAFSSASFIHIHPPIQFV